MNHQTELPVNPQQETGHPRVGSILLFAGAALICLAIVDRMAGLSFWMPRSWYSSRPVWYLFAAACMVTGALLLRPRRGLSERWNAPPPGIRFEQVFLYTRTGCHLCDQAKDALLKYAAYLPPIEEVDIDTDQVLRDRYSDCVPVIEIDRKIRFRGELNEFLLRRLIEGARPRA